ncbi:type II secretion system protein N [Catenovulum sediminis]|uniref:Type II secretion system protein N n=1 Tax=Catenovulum sediminis TaxID=1740262 RepID=A0ABV1RHJ1_9ALTE|nr:type II secretion system protein N [Catenovulum sediminis]
MKVWISRLTWAILFYLIFLLATIPAHLVTAQVTLPKNIELGNVSGTLWQGKVDMLRVDKILLKDVRWDVVFSRLLTAKLAVDIEFGDRRKILEPQGSLTALYGASGPALQDVKVKMPADLIAQQIPIPFPVEAAGLVELNLNHVEQGKPVCSELDGRIDWRMASVNAMNSNFVYGDIAADLSCDEGAAVAIARGNKEILILDLKARLNTMKNYAIGGHIALGPKADTALRNAIGFLGNPDADGRYMVKFSQ